MNHSWNIKRLGDICTSELGKTRDEKRNKGSFRPYLCAVNVQWDKFELSELKEMRFEDNEYDRYTIRKGDLVICEGGDIGRAAIWDKDEPIHYQNALHRVRFNEGVDSRFILYYLYFLKQTGILDGRYGKGVTIKHLVKSSLLSIPVPVPPIDEQQRIVFELDLLTDIIDKKKAQLRDLDALAQSIFYEMFGDPITNDKGWPKRMLKQLGLVITGNTPSTKDVKNYASEDVCFFKPSDICKDSVSFLKKSEFHISSYAFEKSRKLPKGSVLTTCIGIVGKVGILTDSATCNQQINAIIPENVESPWLAYAVFLQKKLMEEIANAPVVPIINKGDFSRIQVPVPPIEKQEQFSQALKEIECQKQMILLSKSETEKLLSCRMASYFG